MYAGFSNLEHLSGIVFWEVFLSSSVWMSCNDFPGISVVVETNSSLNITTYAPAREVSCGRELGGERGEGRGSYTWGWNWKSLAVFCLVLRSQTKEGNTDWRDKPASQTWLTVVSPAGDDEGRDVIWVPSLARTWDLALQSQEWWGSRSSMIQLPYPSSTSSSSCL